MNWLEVLRTVAGKGSRCPFGQTNAMEKGILAMPTHAVDQFKLSCLKHTEVKLILYTTILINLIGNPKPLKLKF